MENLDARVTRLEDAFVDIVDLSRNMTDLSKNVTDLSRNVTDLSEDFADLSRDFLNLSKSMDHRLTAVEESETETKARVVRVENAVLTFAGFATAMDERTDSTDRRAEELRDRLHEWTEILNDKISALVDAQIQTEKRIADSQAVLGQRLAELAGAQALSEKKLAELADAQALSDKKLAELAEAQALSEKKLAELADAQALSDKKLAELAESQSHSDERLNALINIVDRHVTGDGHGTSQH